MIVVTKKSRDHLNRLKKACGKIQHPFIIKVLEEQAGEDILQHNKSYT